VIQGIIELERWISTQSKTKSNILPREGIVYYYGIIMSQEQADKDLELLL